MARIRSVRPELRTSLTALRWPREVRYFWVLLWGYLDDHGYGVDEPRLIKPDCFPMDDDLSCDDIDKWLTLIAGSGALCRFRTSDGRRYLHAPKWAEYQRPQHPAVPKIPVCTLSHETFMSVSGEPPESVMSANGVNDVSAGQAPSGDSHEDSGESHETLTPYVVGVGVTVGVGVEEREREPRSKPAATLLANAILDEHKRLVRPSLPRDLARTTGEVIDSLLDDPEIKPDEIRKALAKLRANPKLHPKVLSSLVNEIRQLEANPELGNRASPRHAADQAALQRAMERANQRTGELT